MGDIALDIRRHFTIETCINCGVEFCVLDFFQTRRREDKRSFFCPNGHSMVYCESEADKLRKELDIAKKDADWQRQRRQQVEKDREAVQRRLTAQFGENTKLRRRIGNGVCPCCHRTFKQVQRHMMNKHPDYKDAKP